MNKREFFDEFKELCEYYNSNIYENKKITRLYYEKVKSMPLDKFKKLCEHLISEYKFMPKVADFENTSSGIRLHDREYSEEFLNQFYDIGRVEL